MELIEPNIKTVLHFGGMAWKVTHNESNSRGGFVRHWESYSCTVAIQIHGGNVGTFYWAGAESCPSFHDALKSACRQHAFAMTAAYELLRRGCPDMLRGAEPLGLEFFQKRFSIY